MISIENIILWVFYRIQVGRLRAPRRGVDMLLLNEAFCMVRHAFRIVIGLKIPIRWQFIFRKWQEVFPQDVYVHIQAHYDLNTANWTRATYIHSSLYMTDPRRPLTVGLVHFIKFLAYYAADIPCDPMPLNLDSSVKSTLAHCSVRFFSL